MRIEIIIFNNIIILIPMDEEQNINRFLENALSNDDNLRSTLLDDDDDDDYQSY
jgi:hypothetical protein